MAQAPPRALLDFLAAYLERCAFVSQPLALGSARSPRSAPGAPCQGCSSACRRLTRRLFWRSRSSSRQLRCSRRTCRPGVRSASTRPKLSARIEADARPSEGTRDHRARRVILSVISMTTRRYASSHALALPNARSHPEAIRLRSGAFIAGVKRLFACHCRAMSA